MLKKKEEKQSELIKIIKKTQKDTNKKLKELSENKEKFELQTCQRCSRSIHDGYTFQYMNTEMVFKSPNGTLKRIQSVIDDEPKM